jgi:hypothetical protein
VSDIVLENVVSRAATGELDAAPLWTCGAGPVAGNTFTTCLIAGKAGSYEFDVRAPGFNAKHVTVTVPAHMPTECCPVNYVVQTVDVHLWRPLDPACASELTGVPPEEISALYEPPVCEVHPDLPPMAEPPASCEGLEPSRVAGRTLTFEHPEADFCGQPYSDGRGTFMAPMHLNGLISLLPEPPAFWGGDGSWSFFASSSAYPRSTGPGAGPLYARVVPGHSGFVVFDFGHGMDYPGSLLAVFDSLGNETQLVRLDWRTPFDGATWPAHVAGDGHGGSVLSLAAPGCGKTVFGLYALAFDASGDSTAARFPVVAISGETFETVAPERYERFPKRISEVVLAGVDGEGRILVTWEGGVSCGAGTIAARWFDRSGKPLTPVFRAAADMAEPSGYAHPWRIARLMDGSLVLQTIRGGWVRRFVAPEPAAGPVPAWLAGRHEALELVRGGRAYALVPEDSDCRPRIDLRSAAGEACGVLEYPPVPGALTAPCNPASFWPAGRLRVGFDGSVSRLRRATHYGACDNHCCEYEWWLGELR